MTGMLFRVRPVSRALVPLFCLLVLPATVNAAESVRLEEPDNVTDGSNFGRELDIDGDRMFVGSNIAGFIYGFVDGSWQLQAQLEPADSPRGFGQSAAMEGDTVVIGSWAEVDGQTSAGAAYVFEYDADTDSWREAARVTAETPVANDFFGSELATDGDTIVLSGARYSQPNPVILERDADGEWVREALIAGQAGNEATAGSVAIEGDTLAVAREGELHVYEDEGGEWVLAQVINESGPPRLEGDTLVIAQRGADSDPDAPVSEGRVLVYERGADAWSHTATLYSPDAGPFGYFGSSVDIEDGLLAVAEGHETMAYYAYMKDENGDWVNFHARPPSGSDRAEFVMAISARSLAVGYNGTYASHVDVFDVGELMAENDEATNNDGDAGDNDNDNGSDDGGNDSGNDDTGGSGGDDTGDAGSGDSGDPGSDDGSGGDDGSSDDEVDDSGNNVSGGDNSDSDSGDDTGNDDSDGSNDDSGDGSSEDGSGNDNQGAAGDNDTTTADTDSGGGGGGSIGWLAMLLAVMSLRHAMRVR